MCWVTYERMRELSAQIDRMHMHRRQRTKHASSCSRFRLAPVNTSVDMAICSWRYRCGWHRLASAADQRSMPLVRYICHQQVQHRAVPACPSSAGAFQHAAQQRAEHSASWALLSSIYAWPVPWRVAIPQPSRGGQCMTRWMRIIVRDKAPELGRSCAS